MKKRSKFVELSRFLSGTNSPEESKTIDEKMKTDKRYSGFVELLQKIWKLKRKPVPPSDVDEAWMMFQTRLRTEEAKQEKRREKQKFVWKPSFSPRPSFAVHALQFAAVFIILAIGFFQVQGYLNKTHTAPKLQSVSVDYGERLQMKLPDGSSVTLDAGSYMEWNSDFTRDRKIYLKGEAYFQVAHNPQKPFRVYSDGSWVQVLGTKFNVRAWDEDIVAVTVNEGKVALHSKNATDQNNAVITKGQKCEILANGVVSDPVPVNVEHYLSWMNNEIRFQNVPIRVILNQLERWYNFDIHMLDENLLNRRMTIHIKQSNINATLELISVLTETKVERDGNTIRFVR